MLRTLLVVCWFCVCAAQCPATLGERNFMTCFQPNYDPETAGAPVGTSYDGKGYQIMNYLSVSVKLYSIAPTPNPNILQLDVSLHINWFDPDAAAKLPKERDGKKYKLVLSTANMPKNNFWTPAFLFGSVSNVENVDDTFGNRAGYLRLSSNVTRGVDIKTQQNNMDLKKRVKITVNCKNKFQAFPFDKHECTFSLVFGSGLFIRQLDLQSSGGGLPKTFATYEVTEFCNQCGPVIDPWDNSGKADHSIAAVKFEYTRTYGKYFAQQIFPLLLVSIVSLSSLFVDVAIAPARAALSITSMLSLITLMFVLTKELPQVPYLSITGGLIFIALVFAVVNLMVFVVSHWLLTQIKTAKPAPAPGSGPSSQEMGTLGEAMLDKPQESTHVELDLLCVTKVVPKDLPNRIQRLARPLVCVLFFTIFFLYLVIAVPVNRGKEIAPAAAGSFWEFPDGKRCNNCAGCKNADVFAVGEGGSREYNWRQDCFTDGRPTI